MGIEKRKVAAQAQLADDGNLAAHELNQLLRQRQPDPGAAVFPRDRVVGLLEAIEDPFHILVAQPDAGVANAELQHCTVVGAIQATHRDEDLATLGKFDRVVVKLAQDLAQTQRIADDRARNVGRDIEQDFQRFSAHKRPERMYRLADFSFQIEFVRFERQFSGFEF